MAIKKNLVRDRIDRLGGKQDIEKPESRDIGTSRKRESERFKKIRRMIERGETTNYYINKRTGELMQRILVHLPLELVENLKREAFESIPRKTVSELIREMLKS